MSSNKIYSLILLSRPVNVVISMLSVFIAVVITGSLEPFSKVLLAIISGGVIAAAANTINDYYDLEIDRINKPYRPLPSGKIPVKTSLGISLLEFVCGVFLAFLINYAAFFIASGISALLFLYSFKLKRLPLSGNLAVSFASAMAFIYGGVAVNRIRQTLIPAAFAFFYHFGREIIKDIQDMAGDSAERARTFPLVFGKNAALMLTTVNFIFLMLLIAFPAWTNYYHKTYLIIILLGVYPVLIWAVFSIWTNQSFRSLGRVSNILKADMLIGLLAIYFG